MFKEFRVSNFKSIQKEQVFTLEACPKNTVSEYPEHIIEVGEERLLKVTSIYGPNGGGKSNLFKALQAFLYIIYQNPLFSSLTNNENYFPNVYLKNKNTEFTLFIIKDNYEIGYSIICNLNTMKQIFNPQKNQFIWVLDPSIIEEEMVYRKLNDKAFETMFKRDGNGIVTSKYLDDIDLIQNKKPLAKDASFLKYFVDTFVEDKTNVDATPIFLFNKEVTSYFWLNRENRTFVYLKKDVDLLTPCINKAKQILNAMDLRIKDLVFKNDGTGIYHLYIEREAKNGKNVFIPLNDESSGTIKTINIVFDLLSYNGASVFLADDFDSHLHPKLVRAIIEMFTSKDNKTRQLILNSHDIINMSNTLFRRDEIWFAYLDDDYSSKYVPLSSVVNYKGEMIRKDAVYSKQYLEGRYGADPFIKKGLGWCDE